MFAIGRRELLLGAGALTLVGCNGSGGGGGVTADDMTLGDPNARVTLVEYASVMCSHCATFHHEVWPTLKAEYIDTNRIHFIFREILAPAAPEIMPVITLAGFQLARCGSATPDAYFSRVGVLMEQQPAIFAAGSVEGVTQKYIDIGQGAGLSREQVMECLADPTGAARVQRLAEVGNRDGVTGTPQFVLNGERIEDPTVTTLEGMKRILDAALAAA